MSHHRRSPRPIAGALETVRTSWQPPSPLGRAQTAWDEIGRVWAEAVGAHGPYIVERTSVVSLKAGVLTVSCSESVVADTLQLESERVLERLNSQLEGDPVTRLKCITQGRSGAVMCYSSVHQALTPRLARRHRVSGASQRQSEDR